MFCDCLLLRCWFDYLISCYFNSIVSIHILLVDVVYYYRCGDSLLCLYIVVFVVRF